MHPDIKALNIKIFADGADLTGMIEMASKPYISGFTTNPTLMRKAGVTNYSNFAKQVLEEISHKPISFEVFSDDLEEMSYQAEKIASWGANVYVKIPITNSRGDSTFGVIEKLTQKGVKVNITALMNQAQVAEILPALNEGVPSYVSIFAGRIADTGRNPEAIMIQSLATLAEKPKAELIWASPRELLNIFQANAIGCHVITATNEILNKLELYKKDLKEYSLETVQMFQKDATSSNYSL